MMYRVMPLVFALAIAAPQAASAQRRGNEPPPGAPQPRRQQALQRQVRQAFAGVVQRQLGLNAEQSRKLQDIDAKYQRQRADVMRDERTARQDLRAALADTSATPDQTKVDGYLSRLVQAQRKRADILDAEQKELAGFLNPVQRAKFIALREQLQKRVAQLRQDGARGNAPTPPPPQR